MLKFGNKDFRNIQEQVAKNMTDIQDIMQGATVLADFGIKVVGQVENAEDLPDPAEYEGDYGDAYLVGEEDPYDFYIFTRAFEGQEEPQWFNLGIFPQPGPQGPAGPAGTPVFPVISNNTSTTTLDAGQSAHVSITQTGSTAAPTFNWSFEIPQGARGATGATGATGPQGPRGAMGYVNLLRQDAAHCVEIGEGYMDSNGDLQLLTELDPKTFTNCGQIRGPKGDTGNTGQRGPTGYVSILRATAEDCVAIGEGYMNSSGYLMLLTDLDPRTFTNCGQLRGPAGNPGAQGPTGYVNIVRPDAASCTELYDAYIDSNGNLQILTALPSTFTYGGRIKGETGSAATIAVGTVTTGAPGSSATVTNRGTSTAAIFDFSIPQGNPGEDVGINPTIPSGTPTSSLVAIKSGNDYYTVPQGETTLQFNVSVPSGTTATTLSTIKDGQNYYEIPSGGGVITDVSDSFIIDNGELNFNFATSIPAGEFSLLYYNNTPNASSYKKLTTSKSVDLTDSSESNTCCLVPKGISVGQKYGQYSGVLAQRAQYTLNGYTASRSAGIIIGQSIAAATSSAGADGGAGNTGTRRLGIGYLGKSLINTGDDGGFGFITTDIDTTFRITDANFNHIIKIPNTASYTAPHTLATIEDISNITFNPTVPSGTTPTPLTNIKDDNTNTYYSISGGGGGGTSVYAHSYIIGYNDAGTGSSEYAVVQFLDSSSTAYATISALMARIGEVSNNGYMPFNTKFSAHCVRAGIIGYYDPLTYAINSDTHIVPAVNIVSFDSGDNYTFYLPDVISDPETGDSYLELKNFSVDISVWDIITSSVQSI